jgi:hypothetical protein
MRAFQPQLPEQPIFYPVLSEAYAVKIARDHALLWTIPLRRSYWDFRIVGSTNGCKRLAP